MQLQFHFIIADKPNKTIRVQFSCIYKICREKVPLNDENSSK